MRNAETVNYWPSINACGWNLPSVVGLTFAYSSVFHLCLSLGSDSVFILISAKYYKTGGWDVFMLTWDKYHFGFNAICLLLLESALLWIQMERLCLYQSSEERFALLRLPFASLLSVCAFKKDLNDFSTVLWILAISLIHNAECCREV